MSTWVSSFGNNFVAIGGYIPTSIGNMFIGMATMHNPIYPYVIDNLSHLSSGTVNGFLANYVTYGTGQMVPVLGEDLKRHSRDPFE